MFTGVYMDRPRDEAHAILFKGQSNVALIAKECGCSVDQLQQSFRQYVAANPIDEDVWRGDIEICWPWS